MVVRLATRALFAGSVAAQGETLAVQPFGLAHETSRLNSPRQRHTAEPQAFRPTFNCFEITMTIRFSLRAAADLHRFIVSEQTAWGAVITRLGITPE